MTLYTRLYTGLQRCVLLRSVRRELASPVREVRADAVQAAVLLQDRRGLRRALRNADPWVRREAVKGLAQVEGVSAARRLVRLLRDADREVAHAAAECLAHMDGPGMLWALRRCLASEDWMVRFFGVIGVARIDSPAVIPLLEVLQEDEHSWVRDAATQALQRLTLATRHRAETPPS